MLRFLLCALFGAVIQGKPQWDLDKNVPYFGTPGLVSISESSDSISAENSTVQIRWLNDNTMQILWAEDGHIDDIIYLTPKSNFYPAPKEGCTFTGKLEKDLKAEVSVVGCQHSEETVASIGTEQHVQQFILKDGITKKIVQNNLSQRSKRLADDEEYFDYDYQEDRVMTDTLETGEDFTDLRSGLENSISSVPDELTLAITIGYDTSLLAYRGSEDAAVNFLNQAIELAKPHFKHSSLSSKINFKIDPTVQKVNFATKAQWLCNEKHEDLENLMESRKGNDVPLIIFTEDCATNEKVVRTGCAFAGAGCGTTNGKNLAIIDLSFCKKSAWLLVQTTNTLVHEIGHLIGMKHDFDPRHSQDRCDGQGFMSYGKNLPEKWSSCSDSDFVNWYFTKGHTCTAPEFSDDNSQDVCEETKESTRLWAHYGASLKSSLRECSLDCSQDPNCFAATWDSEFRNGGTLVNCFKYYHDFNLATKEDGFTSVFCRVKPGCGAPQKDTRLWGHNDQSLESSIEECSKSCAEDSSCHAITWTPDFSAGNPDYNCWKFPLDYQRKTTGDSDFTSVFC